MKGINQKIEGRHLSKTAYLYIRQSTLRQVQENTESTIRQYALREKLTSLGWDQSLIEVVDCDLGHSAKTAENRDGFQKLVADVANGMAGAVACIEASRLSRSSSDWSRLIEYCAMTDTLLIDADGVYDPNDFNDRLLLGLKGTMSEAELHFLQERMRGGLLNKAKRGELRKPLPIGYLYDECGRIIKDDDIQIREAIELFFRTFCIVGTAHGMVDYYKKKGYKFPHRIHKGFRKGEVVWMNLANSRVLDTLHNPTYAGVYHYGENQTVWTKDGKKSRPAKREDWHVFLKDHHDAYISYEDYERNERILQENTQAWAVKDKKTPPREGSALLQGIVLCGKCGSRMSIRYKQKQKGFIVRQAPVYMCQRRSVESGEKVCQSIAGENIDELISEIVKAKLTPEAIEKSVEVQKEVNRRKGEQSRFFQLQVEKARYEADIARRRYMNVDPDNRLVSLELESAWNLRLAQLLDTEKQYEDELKKNQTPPDRELEAKVSGLAENFHKIWDNPELPAEDKKRIIRYLIEDVTIKKGTDTTIIQIRYRGGTTDTVEVSNALPSYKLWTTTDEVIDFLRKEGSEYTSKELAEQLNAKGLRSGKGCLFDSRIVQRIMKDYGIQNKREKYLSLGYIPTKEKAEQLGISTGSLVKRVRKGMYCGEVIWANDKDLIFKSEG
ncbi:recombinase family protein [Novisyntrophococcus fermenticellae]|uniref:recombinase family protein n=1 Tax=Novisyntrophococcus fermenticellae TaxID=2068655 RepID=UPI001E4314D8|nr:recombinase family protein [Novisyntrophococcus fermenticellae]